MYVIDHVFFLILQLKGNFMSQDQLKNVDTVNLICKLYYRSAEI